MIDIVLKKRAMPVVEDPTISQAQQVQPAKANASRANQGNAKRRVDGRSISFTLDVCFIMAGVFIYISAIISPCLRIRVHQSPK
jgi:hypothetical protein